MAAAAPAAYSCFDDARAPPPPPSCLPACPDAAQGRHRPAVLFGRVGPDTFVLDFRGSLSTVQAFAIGLTAFEAVGPFLR